jgi:hypothetical protein
MSAELARIAVVGAGDLQAKAFLETLKEGGCTLGGADGCGGTGPLGGHDG